jgi:hypothetical protein
MSATKQQLARLQFELSYDKLQEFERLRLEGGFETRKELLNNALTLLSWAIRHAQAGHTISALDEKSDKSYDLEMPFLTYAAKNAAHRS